MSETVYQRKLENWLDSFIEWSLPRSEAPVSFHLWTGLFTLASVLKRRVRVPKKILGNWEVSPSLYVIFVAPPGKARKSTTASYAEELLHEIPTVHKAATSLTKEKLLMKLGEIADSSLSIFSSEFAMFIQKSGLDMYDVLTHLFDANRNVSVETIGRDIDYAEKPCINLLACTTPEWISSNMPESVIGGGFASRVIFVFEDRSRRHVLYYDELGVDWDKLNILKTKLVDDLLHIAKDIEGDFDISREAREFMKPWYDEHNERNVGVNYRLQGYFERKNAHIHKVAILLHVARSDSMILEFQDFQKAMEILDNLEKKLPQTFANIGKNPFAVELTRIRAFIQERKKVSRRDVLGAFYHQAEPRILNSLIQSLIDSGDVVLYLNEDDPNNLARAIYVWRGT